MDADRNGKVVRAELEDALQRIGASRHGARWVVHRAVERGVEAWSLREFVASVAPFGVGALLYFSGQSFVAADISKWTGQLNLVPHSSRFARQLGVEHLRLAPIATDQQANSRVPYIRFPRALFCPKCRLMDFWNIGKERSLL